MTLYQSLSMLFLRDKGLILGFSFAASKVRQYPAVVEDFDAISMQSMTEHKHFKVRV
jgi:hypothetical protein